MTARRWILAAAIFGLGFVSLFSGPKTTAQAQAVPQASGNPIPMLAYYYIWFDPGSWERAKTDYPLLGRYSSSDEKVMLQHIQWAKQAGIDGFIVSWKSTEVLNARLDLLVKLAEQEDFKLVVIYQGLDFERDPLPIDRIASDLSYFIEKYAANPVFQLFSKPVVIWSGTWEFSPAQVAAVAEKVRGPILLLASEKNLQEYSRLAELVDGDAYYWSSVNPDTFKGYQEKLNEMGKAVHDQGGLWIAPAAPGFDARLVGGSSIVERKDGETFLKQLNAAVASAPDAVGIISWNEFSENSHIEPSRNYSSASLDVLSEFNYLPPPAVAEFDSSEPEAVFPEVIAGSRIIALGGLGVLILGALIIIVRRRQ